MSRTQKHDPAKVVKAARRLIRKHYGGSDLRPEQRKMLRLLAKGNDVVGVVSTGSGKSAIFQTFAKATDSMALIVTPLKALMRDQVARAKQRGYRAAYIASGDNASDSALDELAEGALDLLYVSPERLRGEEFLRAIRRVDVGLFAVDEAHCIGDWGQRFRPAYGYIGDFIDAMAAKRGSRAPVLALTGTATPDERAVIADKLHLRPKFKSVVADPVRENLSYRVIHGSPWANVKARAMEWRHLNYPGRYIVYCGSRSATEMVAATLNQIQPVARAYHAGMDEKTRKSVEEAFAAGKYKVIVATNAFGMGIDIPDIREVVHFTPPKSIEALTQECVDENTRIATGSGDFRTAKDITVGDTVLSWDEGAETFAPAKVHHVFSKDVAEGLEIRTRTGATLRVTTDHPVYVNTEAGQGAFFPANKVRPGDPVITDLSVASRSEDVLTIDCLPPHETYVRVTPEFFDQCRSRLNPDTMTTLLVGAGRPARTYRTYRDRTFGSLSAWASVAEFAGFSRREFAGAIMHIKGIRPSRALTLPVTLDADVGWLVGIVATDGYIREGRWPSGYTSTTIKVGNTNSAIIDKLLRILKRWGMPPRKPYLRKPELSRIGRQPMYEVSFSSPALTAILNWAGVPTGRKSYTVQCPEKLIHLPDAFRAGYVAGVFDGDGCYDGDARIYSASWSFVAGLCRLIRVWGVCPRIGIEPFAGRLGMDVGHGYAARISKYTAKETLKRHIGKYAMKRVDIGRKLRQPNHRRARPDYVPEDVVIEVTPITAPFRVVNFTVEPNNTYLADGVVTHNCGRAGRDGKPSVGTMLYDQKGVSMQKQLIQRSVPDDVILETVWEHLNERWAEAGDETVESGVFELYDALKPTIPNLSPYDIEPTLLTLDAMGALVYRNAESGQQVSVEVAALKEALPQLQPNSKKVAKAILKKVPKGATSHSFWFDPGELGRSCGMSSRFVARAVAALHDRFDAVSLQKRYDRAILTAKKLGLPSLEVIDYKAKAEYQKRLLSRLENVIEFAFTDDHRAFIRNYFGYRVDAASGATTAKK